MKKYLRLIPASLVAAATVSFPVTVSAGNLMNPYPPLSCGSSHCNSLEETKLYQRGNPVVFQTYAKSGECLRIGVWDTGGNDVELNLVTPGQTNYNIESNTSNFECIKLRNLTYTGNYTVIFGQKYAGGVGSRAIVRVGRYSVGDPENCPLQANRATDHAFEELDVVDIEM